MSDLEVSKVTDTRSIILNAALELFVSHNYDGVSVRQIAELAGCNMGAISYHFGGKENLYRECIYSYDHKKIQQILNLLSDPADETDVNSKLKNFIFGLGKCSLEHRLSFCLILKEIYSQSPRIKDIKSLLYWPIFHRVEAFLLEAQKKSILRPDLNVAFFVRMLLFNIQSEVIFNQNSQPNMQLVSKEFMNICNRSIYA